MKAFTTTACFFGRDIDTLNAIRHLKGVTSAGFLVYTTYSIDFNHTKFPPIKLILFDGDSWICKPLTILPIPRPMKSTLDTSLLPRLPRNSPLHAFWAKILGIERSTESWSDLLDSSKSLLAAGLVVLSWNNMHTKCVTLTVPKLDSHPIQTSDFESNHF